MRVNREAGCKRCTECARERPLDAFHANGQDRTGRPQWAGRCKDCTNALRRQRYAHDPRMMQWSVRMWRARNPAEALRRQRDYDRRYRAKRRQVAAGKD